MAQPLLQDWKEPQPLTTVILVMFDLVKRREYVSRTEPGVEMLLLAMVYGVKNPYCSFTLSYSHHLSTCC